MRHIKEGMTAEQMTEVLDEIKRNILDVYRFNRELIVVALKGMAQDDWAAYIGIATDVTGSPLWMIAEDDGTKIQEHIAKAIFPDIKLRYRGL